MRIEKNKGGKISIIFPTEASDGILKWNGKKIYLDGNTTII